MKKVLFLFLFAANGWAAESSRLANTVVLDETGVKNLRIQTQLVEEAEFEETVFALGRIAVYPGSRAVVSSRIPGRADQVQVRVDHAIQKGDVAVTVESRQPGDPPPIIRLTAPLSGIVSAVHIVPGEPVEPGKVLAEIVDLSRVYAVANVPEHLAGKLRLGQKARIRVPAAQDRTFEAPLEHLGALADAENGTIEAAFRIENAGQILRPGMRAEFSIVVEQTGNVMAIPRSALQGDAAGRFVYVRDFDVPNAFVKTPVVVGRTNDRHVEILSGLFPADEVVTHGAYSLAFAGGGSMSLKEALDAAHGHEHAEDGSELTEAERAARARSHPHSEGNAVTEARRPTFWMITSAVLFVALIVVSIRKRGGAHAE
jgi:cobalt-zinc-cadmium efflux system membrane fusion protein